MEARLARAGLRWSVGMSCCEALGCERATGEPDGCLTARTRGSGAPEARYDWAAGDGSELHATIAGRPVLDGLVAFELRFEERRAGTADVVVAALGRTAVSVGGQSRDGPWLQQRPGQVFRYLLASRAGARRSESIAGDLWPDRGPAAVANVRYCIFKLREQLGERGDPATSAIVRDAGGYRIDARRLELDVDQFQRQAASGIAALRRGETGPAETALSEALELYRGDFLADDPYADWAFSEREYLRSLAGRSLAAMAQIALGGGRLVAAADHLQRLAQLEPFDSHVHRMLIEVCLRRGRRTEALRHYHALRARLQRAFGEAPDFELTTVAAGVAGTRRPSAGNGVVFGTP